MNTKSAQTLDELSHRCRTLAGCVRAGVKPEEVIREAKRLKALMQQVITWQHASKHDAERNTVEFWEKELAEVRGVIERRSALPFNLNAPTAVMESAYYSHCLNHSPDSSAAKARAKTLWQHDHALATRIMARIARLQKAA